MNKKKRARPHRGRRLGALLRKPIFIASGSRLRRADLTQPEDARAVRGFVAHALTRR